MLTIEVTQADIDTALEYHAAWERHEINYFSWSESCPVGQALKRMGAININVQPYSIYVDDTRYTVNEDLNKYIANVDRQTNKHYLRKHKPEVYPIVPAIFTLNKIFP